MSVVLFMQGQRVRMTKTESQAQNDEPGSEREPSSER